jgi:hypothetical protein
MSIPAKRPVFVDAETYNGNPALTTLARRLMQWCNFTHDRDLFCTPSDPADLRLAAAGVGGNPLTRSQVSGGSETKQFGVAWLPHPLGPQTQVKVWLYVNRATTSASATFSLTSRRTGRVQTVTIAAGAVGGAWQSALVDAEGGDAFALSLTSTHADAVSVWGVSAWWHQSSIVGATVDAYQKITLGAAPIDGPLSTYLLRWLARRANQFALERPRPAFSKWYGAWTGVGTAVSGRYKVLAGPGVSTFRVYLYARAATTPSGGTATLRVTVTDGGASTTADVNIPVTAYYGWCGPFNVTLPNPGATSAREVEIAVSGATADGAYYIPSVCARELAPADATLLPGAEAVPASFVTMTDEAVSSRHAIVSAGGAGIASLVGNMAWLWKNRGLRSLVSDCRYDNPAYVDNNPDALVGVYGGTPGSNQAGNNVHAMYRVNVTTGGTTGVWRAAVQFTNPTAASGHSVRVTDDAADPWDAQRGSVEDGITWTENPAPQAYLAGLHDFSSRSEPEYALADEFESRAVGFQFEELPLATTGGGTAR